MKISIVIKIDGVVFERSTSYNHMKILKNAHGLDSISQLLKAIKSEKNFIVTKDSIVEAVLSIEDKRIVAKIKPELLIENSNNIDVLLETFNMMWNEITKYPEFQKLERLYYEVRTPDRIKNR